MDKNYQKLFSYLKSPAPSQELLKATLTQIYNEQKFLNLKRRLALYYIGIIGSIIAFIPALKMVISEFSKSGFGVYFSLLFSDTKIVLTYWKNFIYSLMETLPIMSLIGFSFVVMFFLELVKLACRDLKDISNLRHLTNN